MVLSGHRVNVRTTGLALRRFLERAQRPCYGTPAERPKPPHMTVTGPAGVPASCLDGDLPLDRLIGAFDAAASTESQREWLAAFRTRYLDLAQSDAVSRARSARPFNER